MRIQYSSRQLKNRGAIAPYIPPLHDGSKG
jgi:hypothetical protein